MFLCDVRYSYAALAASEFRDLALHCKEDQLVYVPNASQQGWDSVCRYTKGEQVLETYQISSDPSLVLQQCLVLLLLGCCFFVLALCFLKYACAVLKPWAPRADTNKETVSRRVSSQDGSASEQLHAAPSHGVASSQGDDDASPHGVASSQGDDAALSHGVASSQGDDDASPQVVHAALSHDGVASSQGDHDASPQRGVRSQDDSASQQAARAVAAVHSSEKRPWVRSSAVATPAEAQAVELDEWQSLQASPSAPPTGRVSAVLPAFPAITRRSTRSSSERQVQHTSSVEQRRAPLSPGPSAPPTSPATSSPASSPAGDWPEGSDACLSFAPTRSSCVRDAVSPDTSVVSLPALTASNRTPLFFQPRLAGGQQAENEDEQGRSDSTVSLNADSIERHHQVQERYKVHVSSTQACNTMMYWYILLKCQSWHDRVGPISSILYNLFLHAFKY
eukprot:g4263.t1